MYTSGNLPGTGKFIVHVLESIPSDSIPGYELVLLVYINLNLGTRTDWSPGTEVSRANITTL